MDLNSTKKAFLWSTLVCFLAGSFQPCLGLVVCRGEGGHTAIEREHSDYSKNRECAGCGFAENLEPTDCGDCKDVPVIDLLVGLAKQSNRNKLSAVDNTQLLKSVTPELLSPVIFEETHFDTAADHLKLPHLAHVAVCVLIC
jgi:hypothetical protein